MFYDSGDVITKAEADKWYIWVKVVAGRTAKVSAVEQNGFEITFTTALPPSDIMAECPVPHRTHENEFGQSRKIAWFMDSPFPLKPIVVGSSNSKKLISNNGTVYQVIVLDALGEIGRNSFTF